MGHFLIGTRRVLALGAGVLLASASLAAPLATAVEGQAPVDPDTAKISKEKLEAETEKLRVETDSASGLRGFIEDFGVLITALVALVGVGLTYRGQTKELNRQRDADRASRDRAIEQREAESERDLTTRFSQVLVDLGSESEAVQAGAAVALLSFLGQSEATFHHQVRLAALANLKVPHSAAICKLLCQTYEQAMRSFVPSTPLERDLSDAILRGARLRDLDLEGANLAGAVLTRANLSGVSFRGAFGREVHLEGAKLQGAKTSLFNARLPEAKAAGARFQGAELVNCHMKGADLQGARFEGARLQAAHLEMGTDLRGARFAGANVADTYFREALFDDDALSSLAEARNCDKAHLSPKDKARLEELK